MNSSSHRSSIPFRTLDPPPPIRTLQPRMGAPQFPPALLQCIPHSSPHPFSALHLWDKHSSIPSVLHCLDWLSSMSLRTPTPSSFGAPQFHSVLLNPSSFGAPQLKLDALCFQSALLQHLMWYSSFPHNTPHLVLLFSPGSCSHFSSRCIILPLIPPFRFAAS